MPAIGGRQIATYTLRDATGESTSHAVNFQEITVLSLPDILSWLGAYEAAMNAITLGTVASRSWGEKTVVSNAIPSDPAAQREMKLLVQYRSTTSQQPYTLTIGTIDPDVLVFLPGGGDAVAFTAENGASPEIIAWVNAFQTLAVPADDETDNVVVTGMRLVGRNS